jgi:hypothetical protein
MTSEPEPTQRLAHLTHRTVSGETLLSYRGVSGEDLQDAATVSGADQAPESLIARSLQLADGTQVRQLLVDPARRKDGYQRLDNEILAGLRLARQARSRPYPPEVSRLIGYAADSISPFALLEPYRGESADAVAGHLAPTGQHEFRVSLLTGLRWLAEAGIAHCGIGPSTVRWDGEHVLITDFSLATVIGARQQVIAPPAWAALRSQTGLASEGDDILAAGLLIYYVLAGEELTDPGKLDDWPGLGDLLAEVFRKDPGLRPSARELLTERLGARDPVPRGLGIDPALEQGRREFDARRKAKHPELSLGEVAGTSASPASEQEGKNDAGGPAGRLRRLRLLIGGLVTALVVAGLVAWAR